MQLAKLLRRAAPITDVGFVPNLPVPLLDFDAPITLDTMFRPLINQLAPLGVILRRVGPTSENLIVLSRWRPMMLIRIRFDRKVLRHETNLHVWPDALLKVGIEDAIKN